MRDGHQELTACATSAGASRKQGCGSASDAGDLRCVASIEIPFYAINFQREFDRIIRYFISEYTTGRTPNPCVVCNTWLKFGELLEYAQSVGAGQIATGHYARLVSAPDGRSALSKGLDAGKDQSYVLWGIRPEIAGRGCSFLWEATARREIRQIADPISDLPPSGRESG